MGVNRLSLLILLLRFYTTSAEIARARAGERLVRDSIEFASPLSAAQSIFAPNFDNGETPAHLVSLILLTESLPKYRASNATRCCSRKRYVTRVTFLENPNEKSRLAIAVRSRSSATSDMIDLIPRASLSRRRASGTHVPGKVARTASMRRGTRRSAVRALLTHGTHMRAARRGICARFLSTMLGRRETRPLVTVGH